MGRRFRKIPEFRWQLSNSNLSQPNPLFLNPCLSHLASQDLNNLKKKLTLETCSLQNGITCPCISQFMCHQMKMEV